MRVLILGGTREARKLGELLAGDGRFAPTLSLAGRTRSPNPQPVATRIGGFGGAHGLADWLKQGNFDAVIDATHPFAVRISANAVEATSTLGLPFGSIVRPTWEPMTGDRWQTVETAEFAAAALGATPRRVLLTLGRLELDAFARAPQHVYVARTIDPADGVELPPDIAFIAARPPFSFADEQALLVRERIDVLVTKNSGSPETYAKIAAARALGLPVVVIARPPKPVGVTLADPAAAHRWLEEMLESTHGRSARGV